MGECEAELLILAFSASFSGTIFYRLLLGVEFIELIKLGKYIGAPCKECYRFPTHCFISKSERVEAVASLGADRPE